MRVQPYGGKNPAQRVAVEAELPALPLSPIPPVSPLTGPPSGGLSSETTANAVNTNPSTEEDKAPVSNFYRSYIPHASD